MSSKTLVNKEIMVEVSRLDFLTIETITHIKNNFNEL
jgi:hypothetical protein